MKDAFEIFCMLAGALIVMDVFEFTKALASTLQGDTLPKNQKRLTLNPFRHFEPIGFMLFIFCGFGWGKPVETSKRMYKNMKRGQLVTYITPMVVCLLLAFALKLVMGLVITFFGTRGALDYLLVFITYLRQYFVLLVICNLIPIPPMCGSKILCCFLSPNGQVRYAQNERLFQTLFVFLMLLGFTRPILARLALAILTVI